MCVGGKEKKKKKKRGGGGGEWHEAVATHRESLAQRAYEGRKILKADKKDYEYCTSIAGVFREDRENGRGGEHEE